MPKFKGTMMLNSDQTVQERIEEHRRKQAPGGAAEKSKGQASEPAPKKVPVSSAPPSSSSSPRGPVLQPPRVAASTRGRMGGTMMGVAPQAGGVLPPRGAGIARPLPRDSGYPEETAERRDGSDAVPLAALAGEAAVEPRRPDNGPADALAGTLALPLTEPPAEPPPAALPPEPLGASSDSESGRKVARTQPLAAVPTSGERSLSEAGESEPAEAAADAAADPGLRPADTQPPRNRAVAATAALPRQPEESAAGLARTSEHPAAIRPLDVVLIVCTLGLYGVVLWFRQRKRPA
jgi:hypothetical protein